MTKTDTLVRLFRHLNVWHRGDERAHTAQAEFVRRSDAERPQFIVDSAGDVSGEYSETAIAGQRQTTAPCFDQICNNCMKRDIKFVLATAVPKGTGWRYFVDDSDMEGLLPSVDTQNRPVMDT